MKNHELNLISGLTGLSKSTVSKALNHCFGVDSGLRERILAAARDNNISERGRFEVYAILPDLPRDFWNDVMYWLLEARSASSGASIRWKFNIYPKKSDFVLGEYLDEAKRLGARLLLIAIKPSDSQLRLLEAFAKHTPIFFLFERVDIANTFYIGADAYEEGVSMFAQASVLVHASTFTHLQPVAGAQVLLIDDASQNALLRAKGFSDTCLKRCPGVVLRQMTIADDLSDAARIARRIDQAIMEYGEIHYLYTCAGLLSQTVLATVKLGLRDRIMVMGHNTPPGSVQGGVPYYNENSNLSEICRRTAAAVSDYLLCQTFPSVKRLYG